MTPEQLARVRFLVRADAWAEWEKLGQPPDTLDMALTEYGDLRLVAAYVLETVCADLRRQNAAAAEALGGQTKSYEAVGEWKEEFFAPGESSLSVTADLFCSRADALRQQVEAERQKSQGGRQRTVALNVQTGF
ncbi:hypothetical protein [Deinococcus sp.]|uniref:hypothetical protein n=1 Tax=Deinococcus sp. TaxID=47478 RepID=UPI0026DD4A9A|nr:hypothetical protein [Deinococcus sp.]